MHPQSLRTRSVAFAFIFGPPRFIKREEAASVHSRLCDDLSQDDISFRYVPVDPLENPASRKVFRIEMERREGRGGFKVVVDRIGPPIIPGDGLRLLLDYTWPPSSEHVHEQFDIAAAAVLAALEGQWQKVMAETRVRAQCDAGGSAIDFMRLRALRLSPGWIESLDGRLAFAGVKLVTAADWPTEDAPLKGPERNISIEVLSEDPNGLYFESVSVWRQFSGPVTGSADLERARRFDEKPSQYVTNATEHLRQMVTGLSREGTEP